MLFASIEVQRVYFQLNTMHWEVYYQGSKVILQLIFEDNWNHKIKWFGLPRFHFSHEFNQHVVRVFSFNLLLSNDNPEYSVILSHWVAGKTGETNAKE